MGARLTLGQVRPKKKFLEVVPIRDPKSFFSDVDSDNEQSRQTVNGLRYLRRGHEHAAGGLDGAFEMALPGVQEEEDTLKASLPL